MKLDLLSRARRRIAVGLLFSLVGAIAVTLMGPAAPASADAKGCTFVQGNTGALNCTTIRGYGRNVDFAESRHVPGVIPWPSNICNREHQITFTRDGYSSGSVISVALSSCIPGVLPSYVQWWNLGKMKDGSQFCGRLRNSATGDEWTNRACVTIKKQIFD